MLDSPPMVCKSPHMSSGDTKALATEGAVNAYTVRYGKLVGFETISYIAPPEEMLREVVRELEHCLSISDDLTRYHGWTENALRAALIEITPRITWALGRCRDAIDEITGGAG